MLWNYWQLCDDLEDEIEDSPKEKVFLHDRFHLPFFLLLIAPINIFIIFKYVQFDLQRLYLVLKLLQQLRVWLTLLLLCFKHVSFLFEIHHQIVSLLVLRLVSLN